MNMFININLKSSNMKKLQLSLLSLLMLFTIENAFSKENPSLGKGKQIIQNKIELREACVESKSSWDLNINNVRARLRGGGDLWWDGKDPKYIVPNLDPALKLPEVSSIFAGAVWLGGVDAVGNLKLAAQTYRSEGNDFWPGPLTQGGNTNDTVCGRWDRHFNIYGAEIKSHIDAYRKSYDSVSMEYKYDENMIPDNVKGWPSRGNPYFYDINSFNLPDDNNGLAGFHDENNDFIYDPKSGDYPVIEIRGCELSTYPDQMVFWIYNDAGNVHTQSKGSKQINMEVQVQAFAYASNDELNDMTFYRFKLINRAIDVIDSTFFAMWIDPDLGCAEDDYIGCDTTRSLMYMYNEDAIDGSSGSSCSGTYTYGDKIPMIGCDYFRGPSDENGNEIGMSSFIYYNNGGVGNNPPATTDPSTDVEYYRYLSGSWKDGTIIKQGGTGYSIAGKPTKYTFPNEPDDQDGWSMCTAGLQKGDRRTLQASGPFRLDPGKKNELIIGVVWVPNVPHPCPDPAKILNADDLAQALFDNCFKVTDGPDAPDMDFIELDKQLILILSNDKVSSNNANEDYTGVDLRAPKGTKDSLYRFEGYVIYQLANPKVTNMELNDPEKAQIVAQVDIKNGVNKIFNWVAIDKPGSTTNEKYWIPELQTVGADQGISHTFSITEDLFAKGDRSLINHKKYYYKAVAYAYNNYGVFDPQTGIGQRTPYLSGRRVSSAIAIPRPIVDRNQNSNYGSQAIITRIDGAGAGGNNLGISNEMRDKIFAPDFNGEITYLPGRGPINVKVFNPIDTKSGEFILTFTDSKPANDTLEADAKWVLTKVDDPSFKVIAEKTIERINEQIIPEYGFSIAIVQTDDAGDLADASNGFIDASITYLNESGPEWLYNFPSVDNGEEFMSLYFYKTDKPNTHWFKHDPKQGFTNDINVYPYFLTEFKDSSNGLVSPAWQDDANGTAINIDNYTNPAMKLQDMNNVDIVFTKDTSKWSRCVVIETTAPAVALVNKPEGNAKQFDLRAHNSVTKMTDANGKPIEETNSMGMGWFPGYAIDVETGQRLNIFFGEASAYRPGFIDSNILIKPTGADMIFNPTSQVFINGSPLTDPDKFIYNFTIGGQHTVYVTKEPYDKCEKIRALLATKKSLQKQQAIRRITWTFIPMVTPNNAMLPYSQGLIPNDAVISMRVDNPYQVTNQHTTPEYKGYPTYRFKIEPDLATTQLNPTERVNSLKSINVVPNPYYAYSAYETTQFTNVVKVTNLPNKCTVTIYTLDGRFIRQYKRDEAPGSTFGRTDAPYNTYQVIPDLEWDLKNDKGIPIGSGVYLIHVEVPGVGERTLKWFGVGRKFDPTGL